MATTRSRLNRRRLSLPAPRTTRVQATPSSKLLPLGAMLLAASFASTLRAQTENTLSTVTVREKAEVAEGKDSLRATETRIGKGQQKLRDIPQSITVVTERMMDDRNLDTVKDALKQTAGITFQAAEGGEEDIRLRGFALSTTGDIFVDGIRDPAFYDRDTFNLDRVELLRGSASMLFGRGSTGGAVNMVNKVPRLMDENQIDVTVGSHNHRRVVGDFNQQTGESSALRVSAMKTTADNNGAGSSIDKQGIAGSYRWGIGERDEFTASLYRLENNNGINYGMPWIKPTSTSLASATTLLPVSPTSNYGMASDYNDGTATYATLAHTHRFDGETELTTRVRRGAYTRDQRASTIRLTAGEDLSNFSSITELTRGTQNKIQNLDSVYIQSDLSAKFNALGMRHELLSGVDIAQEKKVVYGIPSYGVTGTNATLYGNTYLGSFGLLKPSTYVGTANDGASVNESIRPPFETNNYTSTAWGVYAQDLVQIANHWKLLGGLRYDSLNGSYNTNNYSYSGNATTAGNFSQTGVTNYKMNVGEWSKRVGALFQPNERESYHFSAATSFNTSGDAYSLGASNADVPPEQSINLELGAKIDSADKNFTTRYALFRSTKLHERNTDPLVDVAVLSGKRHATGLELDFTGRITPRWEAYGSFMWIPDARIDEAYKSPTGSDNERTGARPSLTPRISATLWNTYQINGQWRVGAGLNHRGAQTPNRNPGWEAPAFTTADVMAEYRVDEQLTFKGNVSNLTNKRYADQLYSGHYVPGAGRLVQVTGSYKF
ncbi:TonB-dependent siderophore receptor [Limnohabitans sp. Rim8]|uniref:TonB-dependent siderophore receptor n=1 Tax=Limnohabitans curvus TaxID=323423 RepID=A0A315G112_9BURK|nr:MULTISPECIES: TonB-dependent receptor [Limnohabitans]PUE57037.1 TonB-dependent siderophore receptor [Limnohabitans sp. Rim8]PUE59367.1 TonB-dependent siderophore receptor [Limnohabitans curvus]